MDYSEYKAKHNTDRNSETKEECLAIKILSRERYLQTRKACEDYELCPDVDFSFTEDDFDKFTRNFEDCIGELEFSDYENDIENSFEKAERVMEAEGWAWATNGNKTPSADKIKEQVVQYFDRCMESNKPRMLVSSGGVTVETDVYEHYVKIDIPLSYAECGDYDFEE